jgi:cathepsin L
VAKYIDYTTEQIELFVTFKAMFNKRYRSSEEEAIAIRNFINNVAAIDAQNEKFWNHESLFKAAIWMNSDISGFDFLESFTGYRGRARARSYGIEYYHDENLPRYLNYYEQGFVNNVSYQGQCGACWSFAVTGM